MTDRAEMAKILNEQVELLAPIQQYLGQSSAAVQVACARHQMKRAADLLEPQYTDEAGLREILAQELEKTGQPIDRDCAALLRDPTWAPSKPSAWSPILAAMRRLLHQDTGAAEAMREAAARLLDERVAAWSRDCDRLVPAEAVGSVCANAAKAIRALPLPQPPVSDNTKEK